MWLYSSIVLNKDLYYKFPFILTPECPITWPSSSQRIPLLFCTLHLIRAHLKQVNLELKTTKNGKKLNC